MADAACLGESVTGSAFAALLLLASVQPAAAASMAGLDWQQRLGARPPMDAPMQDADGRVTTLRAVASGLPMLLAPGYFHCPNLCGVVRDDLLAGLERSGLVAGRDYSLALLSIDSRETAADAASAREDGLSRFPSRDGRFRHYLVAPPGVIAEVSEAIGFPDRFDPVLKQFLHPAGVAIISPIGRVSGYLLGVGYDPAVLARAVTQARDERVEAANPVLLLCFHYDASTGLYTVEIEKLVRIASLLTVLAVGMVLWLAHRPGGVR